MLSIILISNNILVKTAVRKALFESGINVVEVERIREAQRISHKNIQLVLFDYETGVENEDPNLHFVREIQRIVGKIPVIILSSNNKKEIITRFILEGAEDYILKPFEHRLLSDKVIKFLKPDYIDYNHEDVAIRFTLDEHLRHELYKAKKGGYVFSILKLQFLATEHNLERIANKDYLMLSDIVFREIRGLFWETDVYIQYKVWSHYGFFPFCDSENTHFIRDKIDAKIHQLRVEYPNLEAFTTQLNFSVYPTTSEEVEGLIISLNLTENFS